MTRLPHLLATLAATALLCACTSFGSNPLPPSQPVPSQKLATIRQGMPYAQFEALLGPGWLSTSSPTHEKYWFLDDARIIAVPPAVWQSPTRPVAYRVIGHPPTSNPRPLLLPTSEPLLPSPPLTVTVPH